MNHANDCLDANLAALGERCPAFLSWWRDCPAEPGESHLITSLSGLPDLEIEHPGKRRTILYNRQNPLEAVQAEMAEQSFPKGSLTLLFGLGLGYRALHILRVMDAGHRVCIIERNPDVLRWALALHDYSAEIRRGDILFDVPEEDALRRLVQEQSGAILAARIRLFLEQYVRLLDPRTARLHDRCRSQCNAILVNFNTAVQLGSTMMQNEVENLPRALLGWNPEGLMGGAFRGRPAILVATGPSLQKNISLLRKARGKALIIAVGQALRVLLAYDVRPDILCSIDFGEPNYRAMSDVIGDADMPLLMHPQVYPRIPFEYPGDLFVIQDRHSLLAPTGERDPAALSRGLTVAQTALNLALAMGADPIIFTGQDLSYGEFSHIDGAVGGKRVAIQGSRIIMQNDQVTKDRDVWWVPGYFGGRVPTSSGLLAFLEDIEGTIRRHPDRRFINATEGGAHIAGTERMALGDVVETHCGQEFPIADWLSAARTPLGADPHHLCSVLETSRNHLERLLGRAEKLERMTGKMKSLLPGDGEKGSRQQVHHLQSLHRQVLKAFSSLLESLEEDRLSRLATVRVKHLLIRMGEPPTESGEIQSSAGRTMQYCEELCAGLREVCPPLLEKIARVQPLLDEYAALSEGLKMMPPDGEAQAELYLRLGLCLRQMGHPGMAARELERAAGSDAARSAALEELFALHLDRNRFEQAGECLVRLPAGHPEREALRDLLEEKRDRDRDRLLEGARLCLDRDDFVGCLLACRALAARHGDSPDGQRMRERSLELRERKIAAAQRQAREESGKGALRDERNRRLRSARSRMKEKDYPAALALFRELVETDPRDEEAGLGSVLACEGLQCWEEAEAELRRLMACHPERGMFFRELGNILLHRGNSGEALENYRKAVDLDSGANEFCLEIATTLSGAGKAVDALPFYERHLKDHPNDYRALLQWGDCFLRLGGIAAARMGYEAALRIRPAYGPVMERLKRLEPAASP